MSLHVYKHTDENNARTTGHAWTDGQCANCAAVAPRPWAERCEVTR